MNTAELKHALNRRCASSIGYEAKFRDLPLKARVIGCHKEREYYVAGVGIDIDTDGAETAVIILVE